MDKTRLEAFSDAVLAIIITIMVLEMKSPHDAELTSLKPLIPVFLTYLMSFIYLGIYWSNHHHLLQATQRVSGAILWANLHLLFWLSLIPFVTRWMGENHFAPYPVALYGLVLLCAAVAYYFLARNLIRLHGKESRLAVALGRDFKTKMSIGLYVVAILLALLIPILSCALYAFVAFVWLIPDRRIERMLP